MTGGNLSRATNIFKRGTLLLALGCLAVDAASHGAEAARRSVGETLALSSGYALDERASDRSDLSLVSAMRSRILQPLPPVSTGMGSGEVQPGVKVEDGNMTIAGSVNSPHAPLSLHRPLGYHMDDPKDTTYVFITSDTLYVTFTPTVVAYATDNRVNSEQSTVTRENDSHPAGDGNISAQSSSHPESEGEQGLEGEDVNQSALAIKRARSLQNNEEKLEAFKQSFTKLMELKEQRERREEQQRIIRQREEALRGGILAGGMVLDETQTRMGRNFYTIFYDNWRPPSGGLNFMITISERMMPSRGTSVSIEIDDVLVFQARLQPRYSYIEEVAEQAVAVCQQKLYQMQLQSNQLQTF